MKRYRHRDANYQRFGSAFVPSHKWGKREKKKLARLNEGYTGPSAGNALPTYDEVAALVAILGPMEPKEFVTSTGTTARQWVWKSEPASLEYTLPQAQDPDWSQVFKRKKHHD